MKLIQKIFFIAVLLISNIALAQNSAADVVHSITIDQNIQAPIRLAVDNMNNIYVSDADNNSIEKYDALGNHLETYSLSGSPISVALNNDNQIFVGNENGTIMKIETNGTVSTFYTGAIYPSAMDFNTTGDLFIADSQQKRVLVLDVLANEILSFGQGVLIAPTSIAFDSRKERIFVGEHGAKEAGAFGDAPCDVKIFDLNGNHTGTIGDGGSGVGEFYRIQGVEIGKCGNIYVNDPFQGGISVFDEDLNYITKFGVYGDAPTEFNLSMDVIFDHQDRVIVSSANNSRVEVFDVIDNLPTSNIQLSDASICGGETTDITIDFTGTAPWNFTYTVDGTNPIDVTTSDNPHILTVSTEGIYEITALSDASEVGTCFTGSANITVSHQVPTATMTDVDETICQDEEVNVEIAFSGLAPWEFIYTQDGINPVTVSTNDNNYTLSLRETGLYEMVDLTSNGCIGTSTIGSANIVVNSRPSSAFTAGNETFNICAGDSQDLQLNFIGTSPWSFTYTVDDANPVTISDILTNNYTLTTSAIGTYEVIEITDGTSCLGVTEHTYPSLKLQERPTATMASLVSTICEGEQLQIPVTITGTPPFSFTYNYNNASTITYSDLYYSTTNINALQTGLYELVSVSDQYCDAILFSGQSNITVEPLPNVAFAYDNATLDVSFTNNSSFATSYLWDFGDSQTSNEANPTHTYLNSGTYIVSLTATNTCGVTSLTDTVEVYLVSVDDQLSENIKIYPNPTDGKVFLELADFSKGKITIEVIDVNGKVVGNQDYNHKTGLNFIDLSYLSSGFYTIRLIESNNTRTSKLIIQK